jgi:hypothetical protein
MKSASSRYASVAGIARLTALSTVCQLLAVQTRQLTARGLSPSSCRPARHKKKLPGLFRLREQFSQLQLHFTTCFNSADVLLSQFAFPA